MHGELLKALCAACGHRWPFTGEMTLETACPACGAAGRVRPDVVWFGEMPYHLDEISARLEDADLFVAIGTSGAVYPAAQFVAEAKARGARAVELNLEPSENTDCFDERRLGPATEVVPAWVEEVMKEAA